MSLSTECCNSLSVASRSLATAILFLPSEQLLFGHAERLLHELFLDCQAFRSSPPKVLCPLADLPVKLFELHFVITTKILELAQSVGSPQLLLVHHFLHVGDFDRGDNRLDVVFLVSFEGQAHE